jgi:hypothetical protein
MNRGISIVCVTQIRQGFTSGRGKCHKSAFRAILHSRNDSKDKGTLLGLPTTKSLLEYAALLHAVDSEHMMDSVNKLQFVAIFTVSIGKSHISVIHERISMLFNVVKPA